MVCAVPRTGPGADERGVASAALRGRVPPRRRVAALEDDLKERAGTVAERGAPKLQAHEAPGAPADGLAHARQGPRADAEAVDRLQHVAAAYRAAARGGGPRNAARHDHNGGAAGRALELEADSGPRGHRPRVRRQTGLRGPCDGRGSVARTGLRGLATATATRNRCSVTKPVPVTHRLFADRAHTRGRVPGRPRCGARPMAGRGGAWAAALLLGGAVLVLRTALRPQRAQSLEVANGEWEVPGTVQDDDGAEVAAGHKVLNRGRINWYWIPPKAEPSPAGLPRRLDASAAAAGDPRSSKAGLSPLVLDHVFTTDEGRQAWANVHAFDHGELLTGQMRMVHREPPPPPPPPPERHEDLDGVLHGVIDEAIASAFAKVMSAPPPPSSDDTPEKPEEEGEQSEEASASVTEEADTKEADTRKKLEPIKNPPTHLPWEEKIEESNEAEAVSVTTTAVFTTTPTPTPTTPTPTTTPRPAPTEEQVSEAIAEAVEKEEERKEEENIKVAAPTQGQKHGHKG